MRTEASTRVVQAAAPGVVGDTAGGGASHAAPARPGGRVAPVLLILGLVGWVGFSTVRSYFFYDDYIYFRQAEASQLSFSYLTRELNVHFSPGYRLVDWLFQALFPLNWAVAQGLLLAGFGAALVVLYLILDELFERHAGWALLLVLYGTSLVDVNVIQWWSSGLQAVPSVFLSLVCILCYLRFYRSGSERMLVVSVAAYIIATLFYVQAILVPGYLIVMRVLLLDRSQRLGHVVADTLREWKRVWLGYLIPLVAYLIVYLSVYWTPSKVAPPGQLASFVAIAWARAFVPAILGFYVTGAGASGAVQAGVIAAQIALVGLVAWSIARRRHAWRGWVFLAIGFLANVAIVGIPRVGAWTPGIAYLLRYYTEPLYLAPIALGFVFLAPRKQRPAPAQGVTWRLDPGLSSLITWLDGFRGRDSGARLAQVRGAAPARCRAALARRRDGLASPRPNRCARQAMAWALVVAALGGHLVLAGAGNAQLVRSSPGRKGGPWMRNLKASLARIESGPPGRGVPGLVDGVVPGYVVAPWSVYGPPLYNHYSQLFLLADRNLRFDSLDGPLYKVLRNGTVEPASFVPVAGGTVAAVLGGTLRIRYATLTASSGGGECIQATSVFPAQVELTPNRPLAPGAWDLGIRYSSARAESVPLFVDSGGGYAYPYDLFESLAPGANRSVLSALGSQGLVKLRLDLPPSSRVCISQLMIGSLVARSTSPGQSVRSEPDAVGTGAQAQRGQGAPASLVLAPWPGAFAGPGVPTSLGTLPHGRTWRVLSGGWGTARGRAFVTSSPRGQAALAVVDPPAADQAVQVSFPMVALGAGLVFDYRDPRNYWYVVAAPAYASWSIGEVVDGRDRAVSNTGLSSTTPGTTLAVATRGDVAEVALDGVVKATVTDPDLAGPAAVGLIEAKDEGAKARFSELRVATPGSWAGGGSGAAGSDLVPGAP